MIVNIDENEDFEPFCHRRYTNDGFWEEYERSTKTWSRICEKCTKKVCSSSISFCTYHKKKSMKIIKHINIPDQIKEIPEIFSMVISISSSLNRKEINQVKEFIKKFRTDTQPIHFTCESQIDYIDETTTHLITHDFGSYTTDITKQIIQACVRHIFIGSIQWIISSLNQSTILDQYTYEILREKKSLPNTRGIKQCRFDHLPVFPSSYIFSIECHSKHQTLSINRDELIEIIELSGASLYHDYMKCDRLIILCNTKNEMIQRKKSLENFIKTNIIFCKPNFLFDSIMKSQLEIFPNELLLELFSYISPIELYYNWFSLNQRLKKIFYSLNISLILLDNINEYIPILNEFSSQIIFIHLRVPIHNLDIRKFSNLRSLIIDAKLTNEQMNSIQPEYLPLLRRFRFTEEGKQDKCFDEMIFNSKLSSSWIKVYHLPWISKYFYHQSLNILHIQTIIFDWLRPFDVYFILTHLPTLRRLKVTIISSASGENSLKPDFINPNYQHQSLIDFHVKMNTHNKLDELYLILSHIPFLRYLSITGDCLLMNDFEKLALQLHTQVPQLERLNCSFKQTRIENIKQLHCMSPLFHRMKCREIQWIGTGWYYYCITTEHF